MNTEIFICDCPCPCGVAVEEEGDECTHCWNGNHCDSWTGARLNDEQEDDD